MRKAFRGSEFLYTLRLDSGDTVLAHVPSHHDHRIGERIGIRAEVDHVVTFNRPCPLGGDATCRMPCERSSRPNAATLHALHYHQVDVFKLQRELEKTDTDAERILAAKRGGVLVEGSYPNGMRAYYGLGL